MTCLRLTFSRSARRQLGSAILISSGLGLGLFLPGCAFRTGKQPRQEITTLYSADSPEFRQSAGALIGPDFVSGNDITTLVNGTQIFPVNPVERRGKSGRPESRLCRPTNAIVRDG